MSQYFPLYRSSGGNIKVELDKNCSKKRDTCRFSSFTLKTNLGNLKTKVDKLYIAKLRPVPDDLAKLSNVVKNDVVKKTE